MEAPKEIKIQQMPLKYKKFFATFIMGGASFTAFRHFQMLRKEYSNFVTYYRVKSWINTPLYEWEMKRLYWKHP